MKILKIAGISVLVLGLVLGLTLPALAEEDSTVTGASTVPTKLLPGKVVSIDEGKTFFVIQSQEQEFTIFVDNDTEYFKSPFPFRLVDAAREREERLEQGHDQQKLRQMPYRGLGLARGRAGLGERAQERLELMRGFSRFGGEATFDDITVGAQVVVQAVPQGDNLLAKQVLIVEPFVPNHVKGTVAAISVANKTITIAPADGGEAITLSYNERTRFILRGTPTLEAGQPVRAIYNDEMVARVVFAPPDMTEQAE